MPIQIKTDIAAPDYEIMKQLAGVDFPTLGHFLEIGFVHPAIHRITGKDRIIGRAVTVRMTAPDSALVHKITEMLTPDDILVIDTGGDTTHASTGGVVATAVAAAGVKGIVIDGVCTDVAMLRDLGLAVYARGTSLLTTKIIGLKQTGAINIPVAIGGVAVLPGYVVAGDENGVLIADPAALAPVIELARAADEREPTTLARVRAGEKLPDISAANKLISAIA
jgi:regulator of RNase E activity RraA